MIERIRDLVTSGGEVYEINDIDKHLEKVSSEEASASKIRATLEEMKRCGVRSVAHISRDDGIIHIPSADMVMLALAKDVTFEAAGEKTSAKVLLNNLTVQAMLDEIELNTINKEKGAFIFSGNMKARDLVEFMDCIDKSDDASVEHFFYNADFSRWLKSINKDNLAKRFSSMRRGKYKGIELKNRLIETTKRYVQDKVKSEVKKEIKQKLLNALDGL